MTSAAADEGERMEMLERPAHDTRGAPGGYGRERESIWRRLVGSSINPECGRGRRPKVEFRDDRVRRVHPGGNQPLTDCARELKPSKVPIEWFGADGSTAEVAQMR